MLLYTIVPIEQIVDEEEIEPVRTVTHGGRTVTVRADVGGYGIIDRLISTNPYDYLDMRWQPGTRIPL